MAWYTERATTELLYVLVSAMGGVAKYLNEYLAGGKFHWGLFVANIVLSGFSGLMFKLFGESIGLNHNILFMFAGVGGFMSSSSLNLLANVLTKKAQ